MTKSTCQHIATTGTGRQIRCAGPLVRSSTDGLYRCCWCGKVENAAPIRIIFPDATDTATGHDAPVIRRFAEMPEDRELQALMLRYNATTCYEA